MGVREVLYNDLFEQFGDDVTADQLDSWACQVALDLPNEDLWRLFQESGDCLREEVLSVYTQYGYFDAPLSCVLATWAQESLADELSYQEYVEAVEVESERDQDNERF